MSGLATLTIAWLITLKYAILFPAVLAEGPIITLAAGWLISRGILDLAPTATIIMIADLIADAALYSVGRWGGLPLVRKFGPLLGIRDQHLLSLEKQFGRYAAFTLLVGKVTPGAGVPILIAAGLVRTSYRTLMSYDVPATIIKALALLALGYFFEEALAGFSQALQYLTLGGVGILVAGWIVLIRAIPRPV